MKGEPASDEQGYLASTREDPSYWARALGQAVAAVEAKEIPGGNSPSRLFRVRLHPAGALSTVISKESAAPWSLDDPLGYRREPFVYAVLLASAPDVAPRAFLVDEGPGYARLALEDLGRRFRFPPADHVWSDGDIAPAVRTLARLHQATRQAPALGDGRLMPAPAARWRAEQILAAAADLERLAPAPESCLEPVRRLLAELADDAGSALPGGLRETALLHSDFGPANFALGDGGGRGGGGEGRLVDWHLAAAGPPLCDVACLFYQPYHNHRLLTWSQIYSTYARARERLGSATWPPWEGGGAAAFRRAVAWCALSYLPPLAGQLRSAGKLEGWWANTDSATRTQLWRCLAEAQ